MGRLGAIRGSLGRSSVKIYILKPGRNSQRQRRRRVKGCQATGARRASQWLSDTVGVVVVPEGAERIPVGGQPSFDRRKALGATTADCLADGIRSMGAFRRWSLEVIQTMRAQFSEPRASRRLVPGWWMHAGPKSRLWKGFAAAESRGGSGSDGRSTTGRTSIAQRLERCWVGSRGWRSVEAVLASFEVGSHQFTVISRTATAIFSLGKPITHRNDKTATGGASR